MMELTVYSEQPNFAYFGDHGDWLIAYSQHRDSDVIVRSNFRSILRELKEHSPEDVVSETSSHWLVGWSEALLVRPGSFAAREAEEIREKLEDYIIHNEYDLSELEHDEEEFVFIDKDGNEVDRLNGYCETDGMWSEIVGDGVWGEDCQLLNAYGEQCSADASWQKIDEYGDITERACAYHIGTKAEEVSA